VAGPALAALPLRRSVLDLDSDLGAGIPSEDWVAARRQFPSDLVLVRSGVSVELRSLGARAAAGVLIVQGLLCREVRIRDRYMVEFLGPGDVVQPPAAERPRLGAEVQVTVISDAVLSLLGEAFARSAARWPVLLTNLLGRLEAQRERLAIQGLITHLPRAEHRLLLMLWHLGDSWGRVTVDGMMLPLSLTHDLLGHLTGSRRSTVSLAMKELEANGTVRRLDNGSWLVTPAGARVVEVIAAATRNARPLGETLARGRRLAEVLSESQALRAEAGQIRALRRTRPRG
jgi:CRP-like cAMP-binding protein